MECNKDDAHRAKGIAKKKFEARDLQGAMKFALKAQTLFPGLEGVDQMIATFDVYLASEGNVVGEKDWYSILCVPTKQYKKLVLQFHPNKNKSVGAEGAFQMVQEAYMVLSDRTKRAVYDQKRNVWISQQRTMQSSKASTVPGASNDFYNFTANATTASKLIVSKQITGLATHAPDAPPHAPSTATSAPVAHPNTFWTSCNKCKMNYEYLRMYLNQNLHCYSCGELFLAKEIQRPPIGNVVEDSNISGANQNATTNRNLQWGPLSKVAGAASATASSPAIAPTVNVAHQTYKSVRRVREEKQAAIRREEALRRKYNPLKRYGSMSENANLGKGDVTTRKKTRTMAKDVEFGSSSIISGPKENFLRVPGAASATALSTAAAQSSNVADQTNEKVRRVREEKQATVRREEALRRKYNHLKRRGSMSENANRGKGDAISRKKTRTMANDVEFGSSSIISGPTTNFLRVPNAASATTSSAAVAQAAIVVHQTYEKVKRKREEVQAVVRREDALRRKYNPLKRHGSMPENVNLGTCDATSRKKTRTMAKDVEFGSSSIISDLRENVLRVPGASSAAASSAIVPQAANVVHQTYEKVRKKREEAQVAVRKEDALRRKYNPLKRLGSISENANLETGDATSRKNTRTLAKNVEVGSSSIISCPRAIFSSNIGAYEFQGIDGGPNWKPKPLICSSLAKTFSQMDLRGLLLEKGKIELKNKLTVIKSKTSQVVASEKVSKKVVVNENGGDNEALEPEDPTTNKDVHDDPEEISSNTSRKTENDDCLSYNVPDPDFCDFDKNRTEECFQSDQVWASYDDEDVMPRYYVFIQKVLSLKPFKLRISYLTSRTNSEFGPLSWVSSGFIKTCGDFRIGKYESCDIVNMFSHQMKWEKGLRGVIKIYPQKGDIWAIYQNWSPDWDEDTPDNVLHAYNVVEVLDAYDEEHGISIIPLVKVIGFQTVFQRHLDPNAIMKIPKEEMFRFSHQVPFYRMSGKEARNVPKDSFELDPAAIPKELLQGIIETVEANGTSTVD